VFVFCLVKISKKSGTIFDLLFRIISFTENGLVDFGGDNSFSEILFNSSFIS